MTNLKDKIKSKLKNKKPIPKWQYASYSVLYDFVILLIWTVSVFGLGILINIIKEFETFQMPGKSNFFWQSFIGLPWELIVLFVLLVVLIYFLSKNVFFIYRLNTWLILSLIIFSIVFGYFISEKTGLNKFFEQNHLVQNIYKKQGKFFNPNRGTVWVGYITDGNDAKFIFSDINGKEYTIKTEDKSVISLLEKLTPQIPVKLLGILEKNILNVYRAKIILDVNEYHIPQHSNPKPPQMY